MRRTLTAGRPCKVAPTLLLALFPTVGWASEVYLEAVRGTTPRLVRVLIAPMESAPEGALDILRADLVASGVFEPLLSTATDTVRASLDFSKEERAAAERLGADGVAKARWTLGKPTGGGATPPLQLEARLFDVRSGGRLTAKTYKADAGALRALVHRWADEIHRRYTGRPGIAHSRIAFVSDETGSKEIHLVDYDGFGFRRLTAHKSIALLPRWTADGRRICYTSYAEGNPDLMLLDPETAAPRPFVVRHGLNATAAWSPDGKSVVITTIFNGDPELALFTPEGRLVRRLTHSRGADTSPAWSPNGRDLVFTSDRGGSPALYLMDPEGANLRRLTADGYCDSPSWSPRGDRIAYARRRDAPEAAPGGFDIWSIAPDPAAGLPAVAGAPTRLTDGEGSNENPTWSPDGRLIAFTGTRGGARGLFTMLADGSGMQKVAPVRARCWTPAWSP